MKIAHCLICMEDYVTQVLACMCNCYASVWNQISLLDFLQTHKTLCMLVIQQTFIVSLSTTEVFTSVFLHNYNFVWNSTFFKLITLKPYKVTLIIINSKELIMDFLDRKTDKQVLANSTDQDQASFYLILGLRIFFRNSKFGGGKKIKIKITKKIFFYLIWNIFGSEKKKQQKLYDFTL